MRSLYLEAEPETGYIRDRNVFGDPITIEDTMAVTAHYNNGVLLSYSLVAYAPWEGLRVAITGTKGRIEMDIEESITHLLGDGEVMPAKVLSNKRACALFRCLATYEVEVPMGDGGHGGADPVMLEQIFSPSPPSDPYQRAASHIDGAASVLVGIAANQAMQTGQMVHINNLFPLSVMMEK